MPPRLTIPAFDELLVPAFFVTDDNAAELERWKQEHPDWFVAGTWMPPRRRRLGGGGRFDQGRLGHFSASVGTGPTVSDRAIAAAARGVPLTDPSTISAQEFLEAVGGARAARRLPVLSRGDVPRKEHVSLPQDALEHDRFR